MWGSGRRWVPHKNPLNCLGIRSTSRSSPTPNVTLASLGLSQNARRPYLMRPRDRATVIPARVSTGMWARLG